MSHLADSLNFHFTQIKDIVHSEVENLLVSNKGPVIFGHREDGHANEVSSSGGCNVPKSIMSSPTSLQPLHTGSVGTAAVSARRGAWSRFPGKLDAETERVSRIMLGLSRRTKKE